MGIFVLFTFAPSGVGKQPLSSIKLGPLARQNDTWTQERQINRDPEMMYEEEADQFIVKVADTMDEAIRLMEVVFK